mgnify:CR=1 FL=1
MAFESLTDKLQNVFKKLRGKGRLTEEDVKIALKEVKMALLEADVNFKVVKQFTKSLPPCGGRHPRPPGFDRPGIAGCRFPGPPAAVGKRKVSKIEKRPFELLGSNGRFILGFFRCKGCVVRHRQVQHRLSGPQPGSGKSGRSRPAWPW